MKTAGIEIRGIDRLSNTNNSDNGSCEDLINVKYEQGGLKVCKDKTIISANIPFIHIFVHTIGTKKMYIGRSDNGIVWFNETTGEIIQALHLCKKSDEVYVNSLNNMLVISDKTIIATIVYLYKDGVYELFYDNINVNLIIKHSFNALKGTDPTLNLDFTDKNTMISSINGERRKVQEDNVNATSGVYLVCVNYTLFDGTESFISNLEVINTASKHPNPPFGYNNSLIPIKGTDDRNSTTNNKGYSMIYADNSNGKYRMDLNFFITHKIEIKAITAIKERYGNFIKAINIYCSKPLDLLELAQNNAVLKKITYSGSTIINGEENGIDWSDSNNMQYSTLVCSTRNFKTLNIDGQLLYLQKTFTLAELEEGITHTLEFAGDKQTTEKVLSIDNSLVTRAGNMFLYNKRLHYYNSIARLQFGDWVYKGFKCEFKDYLAKRNVSILILLRNSNGDDLILTSTEELYFLPETQTIVNQGSLTRREETTTIHNNPYTLALPDTIIIPDSRAYRVIFRCDSLEANIDLKSAKSYNYAYYNNFQFSGIQNSQIILQSSAYTNTYTLNNTYKEIDIINVTAQNNPIFFPVEHSYRFDGEIRGLAIGIEQLSDSQIGMYPVNVFTSQGIYALEQGKGTILYSNIVPISGDNVTGEIIQTRYGIVYISNNNIYLLQGRKNVILTRLLNDKVDFDVRANKSYSLCCNNILCNSDRLISQVKFKDFLKDAMLSYSSEFNELIISNHNYYYSYVINLDTQLTHKIGGSYTPISDNLLLRDLETNNGSAVPATAYITIANIYTDAKKTIQTYAYANFSDYINYNCNAGDIIALIVDGTQLATASFSYMSKFSIILAKLLNNIPYLEEYSDATSTTIYSSISDLENKTITIHNLTTNLEFSKNLLSSIKAVEIKQKGIGDIITTIIDNNSIDTIIELGDSVITIADKLTNELNKIATISAQRIDNTIKLTATEPGSSGNNITINCNDNVYSQIAYDPRLTGGKDIGLQAAIYKEIIDYSREITSNRTIHIQTRPFSLTDYSRIARAILSCNLRLTNSCNLSIYIFASNNLKNWKCVNAAQKNNCNISTIRTNRIDKSYRYYAIIINGVVSSDDEVNNIQIEYNDILNTTIR